MPVLDLDAARAARAEKAGEPKTFTLGGESFTLPAEFPMRVATLWAENRLDESMRVLLGTEDAARFEALPGLSADDIKALVEGLATMYGFADSGESGASVASLPNGSRPSRRTSPVPTG